MSNFYLGFRPRSKFINISFESWEKASQPALAPDLGPF